MSEQPSFEAILRTAAAQLDAVAQTLRTEPARGQGPVSIEQIGFRNQAREHVGRASAAIHLALNPPPPATSVDTPRPG